MRSRKRAEVVTVDEEERATIAMRVIGDLSKDSEGSSEQWESVRKGAEVRTKRLSEPICLGLANLTTSSPPAREVVRSLSEDRREWVRFNAALSIGTRTPRAFSSEIVRRLLRDKSARVRKFTAAQALTLRLEDTVGDLEVALESETSDSTRAEIELTLHLLRDGYLLRNKEAGLIEVVLLENWGVSSHLVRGEVISSAGGVARFVRRLRD